MNMLTCRIVPDYLSGNSLFKAEATMTKAG